MVITKKAKILQLYNEGYIVDDIIQKGFTKKYVTKVLKEISNCNPTISSTNVTNIDALKQLVTTIECLQNKYDQLDLNINISIKITGSNNVSTQTKSTLLNPVTDFRDIGEFALKEKLLTLTLKDLIKITKTYTPDISGKMYRQKDLPLIVDYIIERATNLSQLGQVFRNTSNQKE